MAQIVTEFSSEDFLVPVSTIPTKEAAKNDASKLTLYLDTIAALIYHKIRPKINPRNFALSSIIIVLALILTFRTIGIVRHNNSLESKLSSLQAESDYYQAKNQNLELTKSYYSSPEFLTKAAKSKLNKVDPGEKVFIP